MIKTIIIEPQSAIYESLCRRPVKDRMALDKTIEDIFKRVEMEGDEALKYFTAMYDKVEMTGFEVQEDTVSEAGNMLSDSLKRSISIARENIGRFHAAQLCSEIKVETSPGVTCIQKTVGVDRVGIYIPGGTAPLFSTVLMLAVPARLAGCREVILCSPPDAQGNIHPAILYTARLCGVDRIFAIGGAQAIAAMSTGTTSIPKVDKIFGPGNQYVTAAKNFAQTYGTGMDLPAGPSELLVYADSSCDPEFAAADLLSQAEHGKDSQVILVAQNEDIIEMINTELSRQLTNLPRKEIAIQALGNSKVICIAKAQKAFEFINIYAPEHLIIASERSSELSSQVRNAGSVFLGNYCPESAGDYASGTNHTLPTDSWARAYSGVNVDSFCKKITFQQITRQGILNLGNTIIEMAKNELLEGHARAVEVRLAKIQNEGR